MDRLAAASHVRVQRTKTSNYRYVIYRCDFHNRQQTFKQVCSNVKTLMIQRQLGTCKQIQTIFRERLHAKLDHGGV